jgi:hypothetical protein
VTFVRTDVLEERFAYIIRVERISKLGTTLVITKNRCTLQRTAKYMRKEATEWDTRERSGRRRGFGYVVHILAGS